MTRARVWASFSRASAGLAITSTPAKRTPRLNLGALRHERHDSNDELRNSLLEATTVWSPVSMHKMLILLFAGLAVFGLADCGGSGSPKTSATTPTTVRSTGTSRSSRSTGKGLAPYLKCLGQHGVNVKKAAQAKNKSSGGAGAELRKDPHFAVASPICRHFLA
jgi:hypothetical protein